jgi:hypothetical protein
LYTKIEVGIRSQEFWNDEINLKFCKHPVYFKKLLVHRCTAKGPSQPSRLEFCKNTHAVSFFHFNHSVDINKETYLENTPWFPYDSQCASDVKFLTRFCKPTNKMYVFQTPSL